MSFFTPDRLALEGKITLHHRFMLRQWLDALDFTDRKIAAFDQQIAETARPLSRHDSVPVAVPSAGFSRGESPWGTNSARKQSSAKCAWQVLDTALFTDPDPLGWFVRRCGQVTVSSRKTGSPESNLQAAG
jgi:hypothetical protein